MMRMSRILSKVVSLLLSPLIIPTYAVIIALWSTMLALNPLQVRISVTLLICMITCVIPLVGIFILYRLKIISDVEVNVQKDRLYPFIITALCYVASVVLLWRSKAPVWMMNFFWGAFAANVVMLVVNLRWKISGHATAIGGLVGMCFRIMSMHLELYPQQMAWITAAAVIVAGMVGSARLDLERHTLGQVLAGYANGFLCVFFMTSIH